MSADRPDVCRAYPPSRAYEVGREKIREFADAIGDDDPIYRDPDAARAAGHPDVIAPPTFAIVLTMPAELVLLNDPELGVDFSKVVHREQSFRQHRTIRPGDRLVSTVHVDRIHVVAGSFVVNLRTEVHTEDGEPVVTGRCTVVARGTASGEA